MTGALTGLLTGVEIAVSVETEAGEDESAAVRRVGYPAAIGTGVDVSEGGREEASSEDRGCDGNLGRGALRGVDEGIVAGAER